MTAPFLHASTDAGILGCFALMRELRPHLVEAEFVERVRRQQRDHGYELVFVEENGAPVALTGFRVVEFLAWGRVLYVDDLVTSPEGRGRGHGSRLMEWLIAETRRRGCEEIHLDSGMQRLAAHRLYHAHKLQIGCLHFSRRLA